MAHKRELCLFHVISFKMYALKYHPLKNPAQMSLYLPKFQMICEAYEVLSNM